MIRIGPAGWNYKDWAGIVYPAKRQPGFSEPGYLAQFFDTLEINTSFYGPPRATSTAAWVAAIEHNPNFKFTAKLYRAFTHARNATAEDERLVKAGMDPIMARDRLGAILLQFPISFRSTAENLDYVSSLRSRFREYPLVLEVRHRSWDDVNVLEMLSRLGIGICNIDQPLIGKGLRPAEHSTADVGYIRLHGRNYQQWFSETASVADRYDYLYSLDELEPWADRVKSVAMRSSNLYAITNNHHVGQSIANAVQLEWLVNGKPPEIPREWTSRYPQLEQLQGKE